MSDTIPPTSYPSEAPPGLPPLYPVLSQELRGERPGGVPHHLVHIAAVLHRVVALSFVHHREALEVVCQLVAAD